VPRRPSRSRRLATAAVWPAGVLFTSWNYLWRTTALHRREVEGSLAEDSPPELPDGVDTNEVQQPDDGAGPLFHRRYCARIARPRCSAAEIVDRIASDLDLVAPTEFARFNKVLGEKRHMRVGDEYVLRMPGPWDGPVRVVDVTPTSFRFVTLEGHLEAGQIEFRAADDDGDLLFTIESWARSGDRLSQIMYQTLHMAKEVQLHMWVSFLERIARVSGGRLTGGLDIETRRVEVDDEDSEGGSAEGRALGDERARRFLDELHDKQLNFEAGERDQFTAEKGWLVDDYCQPLPSEPPGPPVAGGSFEAARRLLRDYEFADPSIVRAVYHPDGPLDGRDMLLEARFYGLRFRFGVRVGGVVDEQREVDGRPVQVWGWHYRTLQGHLEMGQMDFEVWKWLDTGDVQFRTCRFSRHSRAGHPVVRLGVRLFGRGQQVRFARSACQRMARLTAAALAHDDAPTVPRAADQVEVGQPVGS